MQTVLYYSVFSTHTSCCVRLLLNMFISLISVTSSELLSAVTICVYVCVPGYFCCFLSDVLMGFPILCVCVMVDILLWFPALSRDCGHSVGHIIVLVIHGTDIHTADCACEL